MELFNYDQKNNKEFEGTDSEVRNLINSINSESEKVNDSDFPIEETAETDFSEQTGKAFDKGMEISAEVIVNGADKLISIVFANFAKEKPELFYADASDLKDISKPLEIYFKNQKTNIPPWALALFSASLVLFSKFQLAVELRKKNVIIEKYEKQKNELQSEIDILKKQQERDKLINQLSEINQ
jgi:hypothetical protein